MDNQHSPQFSSMVDLAAKRVGGRVLMASDEFVAEKETLLKPGRGISAPDRYANRGERMDGGARRKRTPRVDSCIIKLGLSGIIKTVDIDTDYFRSNHPPFASMDGANPGSETPVDDLANNASLWTEILPESALKPGSQNIFDIASTKRWTHVRLNIDPQGGVARLRVYGIVIPDWSKYQATDLVDLAAVENGGVVIDTSGILLGSGPNLIMPGPAAAMGDGWETKRRKGPGHDWAVIKLGRPGTIMKIEVDTRHFKGNHPDECSIERCYVPIGSSVESLTSPLAQWKMLLPKTRLHPDTRHFYENELRAVGECTHVRLNIFPDGGVSRLRVWGLLKQEVKKI